MGYKAKAKITYAVVDSCPPISLPDPAKARELLAMNDDDFGAWLAQTCSAMFIVTEEGGSE